jgi:hypothetical protein
VRHRREVGELGFGGAADADAEEALVEVELDELVRALDVGEGDGRAGRDVPDVLAVLLQEVGALVELVARADVELGEDLVVGGTRRVRGLMNSRAPVSGF